MDNNNLILSAAAVEEEAVLSTEQPFIQANTNVFTVEEIKAKHIIPVFIKDNETLISHADFIESTYAEVVDFFNGETVLYPSIRMSHPVKGRVPEAKHKPVNELLECEKTIYYERMAFVIEVPTISRVIDGCNLSLTIGGVKSYSLDNLYNKKGAHEHFKIFIGFQNKVCTNLCVWTDGALLDLKVSSLNMLQACIKSLLNNYNYSCHLFHLEDLCNYHITEEQFAHFIGRCRMYPHLPADVKGNIPQLLFGDTQMNTVVKDYYNAASFTKDANGNLNLWRLYNLFTGANKSTYIDQFVERGINAFNLTYHLKEAAAGNISSWYLSQ